MLKNKLSILIICYDPYSDAIALNTHFLKKYWNDCDLDVVYVTSEYDVTFSKTNLKNVKTNGDLSFFGRLRVGLDNIKTDYILLLLDDYLINKSIDSSAIEFNVDYMISHNHHFCELFTMFYKPKGKKVDKLFLKSSSKNKYRLNLQPAIFSRELLNKIIEKNPFTAWDAEIALMGKDFNTYQSFFSLNHSFSIVNYIDKGYATRKAIKMIKKEHMWNNQRKVLSLLKTFEKWLVNLAVVIFPNAFVSKFRNKKDIYK